MFLFLRLILGHLVGDFLFQTDGVYHAKKKGIFGALLHAGIIFFCLLCCALPYLSYYATWLIIIGAALSHAIQDTIKLHYPTGRLEFPIFLLDQLLHIAFLAPILLFPFASIVPRQATLLQAYYNNDALVLALLCFIASVIIGGYLWRALHYTLFLKPIEQKNAGFRCGMLERFIITIAFLKPAILLFIIIPVMIRVYLRKSLDVAEMLFNIVFASLIGICVQKLLLGFAK